MLYRIASMMLLIHFAFALHLLAEEPAEGPLLLPPKIAVARMTTKDAVVLTDIVMEYADQTIQREIDENGVKRTVTESVKVPVFSRKPRQFKLSEIKVFNLGNQELDRESLAKLLSKEKPILVTTDESRIDPFYASIFRPDTIVIVIPRDFAERQEQE